MIAYIKTWTYFGLLFGLVFFCLSAFLCVFRGLSLRVLLLLLTLYALHLDALSFAAGRVAKQPSLVVLIDSRLQVSIVVFLPLLSLHVHVLLDGQGAANALQVELLFCICLRGYWSWSPK